MSKNRELAALMRDLGFDGDFFGTSVYARFGRIPLSDLDEAVRMRALFKLSLFLEYCVDGVLQKPSFVKNDTTFTFLAAAYHDECLFVLTRFERNGQVLEKDVEIQELRDMIGVQSHNLWNWLKQNFWF